MRTLSNFIRGYWRLMRGLPDESDTATLTALRECASRLRYDGDSHHDRGDYTRRDASWAAMDLAKDAITKIEARAFD